MSIIVVAENSVTHAIVVTMMAQITSIGRMESGDTPFVIPVTQNMIAKIAFIRSSPHGVPCSLII